MGITLGTADATVSVSSPNFALSCPTCEAIRLAEQGDSGTRARGAHFLSPAHLSLHIASCHQCRHCGLSNGLPNYDEVQVHLLTGCKKVDQMVSRTRGFSQLASPNNAAALRKRFQPAIDATAAADENVYFTRVISGVRDGLDDGELRSSALTACCEAAVRLLECGAAAVTPSVCDEVSEAAVELDAGEGATLFSSAYWKRRYRQRLEVVAEASVHDWGRLVATMAEYSALLDWPKPRDDGPASAVPVRLCALVYQAGKVGAAVLLHCSRDGGAVVFDPCCELMGGEAGFFFFPDAAKGVKEHLAQRFPSRTNGADGGTFDQYEVAVVRSALVEFTHWVPKAKHEAPIHGRNRSLTLTVQFDLAGVTPGEAIERGADRLQARRRTSMVKPRHVAEATRIARSRTVGSPATNTGEGEEDDDDAAAPAPLDPLQAALRRVKTLNERVVELEARVRRAEEAKQLCPYCNPEKARPAELRRASSANLPATAAPPCFPIVVKKPPPPASLANRHLLRPSSVPVIVGRQARSNTGSIDDIEAELFGGSSASVGSNAAELANSPQMLMLQALEQKRRLKHTRS